MRSTCPLSLIVLTALCVLLMGSTPTPLHAGETVEATPKVDKGTWPFGEGTGFDRRDIYNLGILGAKARDAAVEPPKGPRQMGTRRIASSPWDGRDGGPGALFVEIVFPEGPADKAGLAAGDVIVGLGKRPFAENTSLDALATALVKAESGKGKGIVTLLVVRAGGDRASGDRERIEVAIPSGDKAQAKAMAKPAAWPARKVVFDRALAWLAEEQSATGGYRETLSGSNGAVVQTALAGLAWLAGGSTATKGPYAENIAKAADFVRERAEVKPATSGGRAGMNQSNWGACYGAIFLGELHAREAEASLAEDLHRIAASIADAQESTGGWAHGPGGANPLGYTELNIVTGLALCGMGAASQAGWAVPDEVLAKAGAYLEASSSGDGGVGYSTKNGQRGQGNIGRTAAALLGYRALGRRKEKWAAKMQKWCTGHAGDVQHGHASLMQHIQLAGVAAHALGKKARKGFWEKLTRDAVLARTPNGSLQPRAWHESLSMSSNSDVTFGEVWTTASWAIVLGCEPQGDEHPGLPTWMGLAKR